MRVAFDSNIEKIQIFMTAAVAYLMQNVVGSDFTADILLTHNLRLDPDSLVSFAKFKGNQWKGGNYGQSNWIPLQLQWEAYYFSLGEHIFPCDPSQPYITTENPNPVDVSARAEFLRLEEVKTCLLYTSDAADE